MNIFDCDRAQPHVQAMQGLTYTVEEFGNLPLRIDDLGETIEAPMRMTFSDFGIALEMGPYSISTEDAAQMRAVLSVFLDHAAWATGQPEIS